MRSPSGMGVTGLGDYRIMCWCGWISSGHATAYAADQEFNHHLAYDPSCGYRNDEPAEPNPEPPIRVSGKMPVRPRRAITA